MVELFFVFEFQSCMKKRNYLAFAPLVRVGESEIRIRQIALQKH
jgi:hypothetical protein